MIRKIEHWFLERTKPAFNDVEGVTAVDMVGKNTSKINEIVELVNNFTTEIDSMIKEFTESTNKDYEAFKTSINQKIIDFIETVDLKLDSQDKEIADSIVYIKENLQTYIVENFKTAINEMADNGELTDDIMSVFDSVNETVTEHTTKIGALETNVNTLTTSVNTHTTQIAELQENSGGSGGTPGIYDVTFVATDNDSGNLTKLTEIFNDAYSKGIGFPIIRVEGSYWKGIYTLRYALTEKPASNYLTEMGNRTQFNEFTIYAQYGNNKWDVSQFYGRSTPYLVTSRNNQDITLPYNLKSSVTPSSSKDLVNKGYVDDKVSGLFSGSNFTTLTGTITVPANSREGYVNVNFPSGFTYDNSMVFNSYYSTSENSKIWSLGLGVAMSKPATTDPVIRITYIKDSEYVVDTETTVTYSVTLMKK